MINSKRGLIKKLQEDKTCLEFRTLYNWCGKNVNEIRQVGNVQTNAFTLLSNRDNKMVESWIYPFNKDIEIENNHIYYYGYFYDVYSAEKWLKTNNIPKEYSEIITIKDNDSINNKRAKSYLFKIKIIDIEIIEK